MAAAPDSAASPESEYRRRLEERRAAAERARRQAALVSNARLVWFLGGVACAWQVLGPSAAPGAWLVFAIAGFIALVVVHDRALRRQERAERAVRFYEAGVDRLADRWMGTGPTGEGFLDPAHPYASDLDLFGAGSLFERLSRARTRVGEVTLAQWLSIPADLETIRSRQAAVEELSVDLDLREEFALAGTDVGAGMHPDALREWGRASVDPGLRGLRGVAFASACATFAGGAAWLSGLVGPIPFEIMLVLQSLFAIGVRSRVGAAIRAAEQPGRDLSVMVELLARIEGARWRSPMLRGLPAQMATGGVRAADRIARLRWLLELLDARRNQLFAPLGALVLWGTQFALAVEAWRARSGPALESWIRTIGEVEALSSLAAFRFESPESAYPELVGGLPRFDASGLQHPLLPASRSVPNDVSVGGELQLLVVSGSNMSGKSTLLRSIGVNAVLAQAGAPVAARSLRMSPLAIGASIRIQDSLLDGRSHFYAEIRRLKQIMQIADASPAGSDAPPLLFLVDEILHGTNSHDRGIGAEAVVRGLIDRGAIGLVTTHDLALARVAEALAPRAANVHFQDHLEDGAIAFDYRLRPGVVEKSNALELMRAVGLEV